MCKISYTWEKTRETPQFSRVPPHVLLMDKMRYLNVQIKHMQESLGGVFENVLDDCGIVSPKLFTKKCVSATSYAD